MIAELLNSASLVKYLDEIPISIDHRLGIRHLEDEIDSFEVIGDLRPQISKEFMLDCYTLDSDDIKYKQEDLVCDDQ